MGRKWDEKERNVGKEKHIRKECEEKKKEKRILYFILIKSWIILTRNQIWVLKCKYFMIKFREYISMLWRYIKI